MSGRLAKISEMLRGDFFALSAFIFLIILLFGTAFGPSLIEGSDVNMNLRMRNAPPFQLGNGFGYILGADSLGRPILPRILYLSLIHISEPTRQLASSRMPSSA